MCALFLCVIDALLRQCFAGLKIKHITCKKVEVDKYSSGIRDMRKINSGIRDQRKKIPGSRDWPKNVPGFRERAPPSFIFRTYKLLHGHFDK